MHLTYHQPSSALLWTDDLFNYIQQVKAGTFDTSETYTQFSYLIVPEVTAHGANGPFTAYFALRAPDAGNAFSFAAPITEIVVWNVINHVPDHTMLTATQLRLTFAQVLAAPTALALEKLILRGNDLIGFETPTEDSANDTLYGWNGNDTLEAFGSGGRDRFYGGNGDDRISIQDGAANTLHGAGSVFMGFGGAGNDTVLGDDRGDHLYGGAGNDSVQGYDGHDLLQGGAGHDALAGGTGNDTLHGDDGNDLLLAGLGTDTLAGGDGEDLFIFTWGGPVTHYDSGLAVALRDTVEDFIAGDDLIRLVEGSLATITLRGQAAFTGANQVRWSTSGGTTTLYINGDADAAPEMAITLVGVTHLDASDFQL